MILAISSASAACSAALFDGDRIIDERHELVGRGHAERLVPMIAELLKEQRPEAIFVDCGPGSFTGVRVGLAAAHGLAIGWGLPLTGFSSTAVLAAGAFDVSEIVVALQGGHGELFVQHFRHDPLEPVDDLRSLVLAVAAATASTVVVAGSGAEALVSARGWGQARDALPRAADARLLPPALRALPPAPIYGRAPDAKPMP